MNRSPVNFFTGFGSALVFLTGCSGPADQPMEHKEFAAAHVVRVAVAPAALDCTTSGLYQELLNPPTLNADDAGINTQLSAILTDKCVNGKIFSLQSYVDKNAGIDNRAVGPAYILPVDPARPNPYLHIQFTNQLGDPTQHYDCGHHGAHAGADVSKCTNLHTHGLHVSPKGSTDPTQIQSDYVFLEISPASPTVNYQFDIPNAQAPGTHWLHAHLHGSTAPQVKNGMAGALILTGALDKTLANNYGIGADNEKIMILQQMSIDASSTPLCGKDPSGNNIVTSINGQCLPVITVKAGDIQRWRFINSGIASSINLGLVNTADNSRENLHEFARDGITMNGTQVQKNILLQPGYRSDMLVQFPACKGQYPCELILVDDDSPSSLSLQGFGEPRNQIAKVIIQENTTAPMLMPPATVFTNPYKFICDPANFKQCSENLPTEKVWFANRANASGGTDKTINDGIYPNTITKNLKLNTVGAWKLWVGDKQSSTANHPFHIHVNPFQVVDKNGFSYWKDTLLVSGTFNKGESNAQTVVSRYERFDGEFVLHCHNLEHEDQGMMMNVVITP